MTSGDQTPHQPPVRLVKGSATPDEVAALVAVLSATAQGGAPLAPTRTSRWASRERAMRRPLSPGRGAWRASAWPG